MAAFEWEFCLVMVEERRPPFGYVVTLGALCGALTELVGMRVFVTIPAIDGGLREVDIPHGQFHIRWLVAIRAAHGTMRSD
jgi:hypothetical protein